MKVPVNHISIYLIKEDFAAHEQIVKNHDSMKSKEVDEVGVFYYSDSNTFPPGWKEKFFVKSLDDVSFTNSSSKGLLLVSVNVGNSVMRTFAVPFGYGWTMLNQAACEERFGLKTTLSIVKPDGLRKISKKNMSSIPKDTSEQLSRSGIVADFGIDIEQDLIQAITGSTELKDFGRMVSGKDSLTLSVNVNISNLHEFLKKCYERYASDDYKQEFRWIDQIAEIKDSTLKERLDKQLIDNITNGDLDKTWMAVPQILEWEDVDCFRYGNKKNVDSHDDIELLTFMDSLDDETNKNLSIDFLKSKDIRCISSSSGETKYRWRAYSCFYCEVIDDTTKKTYLLSNGKWYEIEKEFAEQTNSAFETIRDAGCSFSIPDYNHKNEGDYNEKVANGDVSLCCMDRKNISYGGGHSSIEFCDIFRDDKKIVHVKHYGGSSVLSHLFAQGVVSGELFVADEKFREKVNDKLDASHKLSDTSVKPKAEDYEIIFAIITKSSKKLSLPFFSKVTLRNAHRRLRAYGYKVSLLKISRSDDSD